MSNGELHFRRALPGDRDRAMRLLSKFADDYLPEVWDEWVQLKPGGIYLAETGPALVIREMPWPPPSSSPCCQASPGAHPAYGEAGRASHREVPLGEEGERVVAFLRGRATGLAAPGVSLISPPGDVWCMRSLDWAEEVGVLELSAGASGAEDGGLALALGVSDAAGAVHGGALVHLGPDWDGRRTFTLRWLEVDPEWEGDLLELLARHAWRQGAERFGFSLPLDQAAVLDRWLDGLWPGRDQPGDGGCQPGDAGCLPPDGSAWREHFYVYEIREPASPRL
ncbi:MAG TPA: hypothetical protein GX513_02610 [Firmicutes bacterium]|nr:hypothetical protein [Bacillota bacterium]